MNCTNNYPKNQTCMNCTSGHAGMLRSIPLLNWFQWSRGMPTGYCSGTSSSLKSSRGPQWTRGGFWRHCMAGGCSLIFIYNRLPAKFNHLSAWSNRFPAKPITRYNHPPAKSNHPSARPISWQSFEKSRIKMLRFRIFRINLLWIFHNSLLVGVVRIVSAPPLLPLRIKELPESVGIAIPMHNCIIAFFMSPAYAKVLKGKILCLGIDVL